jgi:hypothetical protein
MHAVFPKSVDGDVEDHRVGRGDDGVNQSARASRTPMRHVSERRMLSAGHRPRGRCAHESGLRSRRLMGPFTPHPYRLARGTALARRANSIGHKRFRRMRDERRALAPLERFSKGRNAYRPVWTTPSAPCAVGLCGLARFVQGSDQASLALSDLDGRIYE